MSDNNTNINICEMLADYLTHDKEHFDKIIHSLIVFEELFSSHKIDPSEKIFLAFNGGKDCLASYIIIKYYFFCKEKNLELNDVESYGKFTKANNLSNEKYIHKYVQLVYFLDHNNFEIEENYVIDFAKREEIGIFYLKSNYIFGINFLISNFDFKLIVMGTRSDDIKQSCGPDLVHPSTPPYPIFLRFYPCFHFSYRDVWKLILSSKIPYLRLYDEGYSSIGKKTNTSLNPHLVREDNTFYPAWSLSVYSTERQYR